jgi:hypothetical protein
MHKEAFQMRLELRQSSSSKNGAPTTFFWVIWGMDNIFKAKHKVAEILFFVAADDFSNRYNSYFMALKSRREIQRERNSHHKSSPT